jgi:thioredoxin-related protein
MSHHIKQSLIFSVLLLSSAALATKLPSADKILAEAKAKAGTEKKNVMLVFESSWCPPCHQFDKFVSDQRIRRIFDQHFVLATVAVGEEVGGNASKNNPGSEELLVKLGGVHFGNTGVPFIFIIDPQGTVIVTSERPIAGQKLSDNIGYPTEPEEIDWFMKMMKKGASTLSEDEARTVEDWLRRDAES